uniref:Bm6413, isoform d n=1 Tax=Brugia malayi TaxID=6279 RepID=A0A1I9FZS0_BRUMA|nr:Bm6413, isoform d [Brugia malayi]
MSATSDNILPQEGSRNEIVERLTLRDNYIISIHYVTVRDENYFYLSGYKITFYLLALTVGSISINMKKYRF